MKLHKFTRIGIGALVVGSLVGFGGALGVAQAATGGPMTITNGVIHGTSGDDVFAITRDALTVSHNRFAKGDPGFASAQDFDTATDGVQTVSAQTSFSLDFDLGDGEDVIQVFGALQRLSGAVDMGAGNDVVDFTGNFGSAFTAGPSIEKIIGSPGDDNLSGMRGNPSSSITILGNGGKDYLDGTDGNDVLDAVGGGLDALRGYGGNDTLSTSLPLDFAPSAIDPGDGVDNLTIVGTTGDDALFIAPPRSLEFGITPDLVEIEDATIQASVHTFRIEHLRLQLLGGADFVGVSATNTTLFVDGGPDADEVGIDARQATVTKSVTNQTTTFSVPDLETDRVMPVSATSVERASVVNETLIATATGPGGGPHVRVLRATGGEVASFYAYGANFPGGVNLAMGDLDGDGDDEVITGVGPGGGPHVRAFHSDGSSTATSFYAYASDFTGGVNVAAIDLDGDGLSEIVTAPASGGGPHIRIWSGDGELLDEWFAPGMPAGGFNIARGPSQGEAGGDQIIISATGGNPSQINVYEAFGEGAPQHGTLRPYAEGFRGGAFVARGEFETPGHVRDFIHDEIVTAAGPGGGPDVRVYETRAVGSYTVVSSFYAFGSTFPGGVNIATCNPDAGNDEILVGAGGGGAPHVRLVNKNGEPAGLSFYAYGENFHGGVRVACGGGGAREL